MKKLFFIFITFMVSAPVFSQIYRVGFCKEYYSGSSDTVYHRELTGYDSLGRVILTENLELQNLYGIRHNYTYDSLNRTTTDMMSDYQNGSWNPLNLTSYIYGSNLLLSEELYQHDSSGFWANSEQTFYVYNSNNDLIHKQKLRFNMGVSSNDRLWDYDYDPSHRLLERLEQQWQFGTYDTTLWLTFQYQLIGGQVYSMYQYNQPSQDTSRWFYYYDTMNRDSVIYLMNCTLPTCLDTLSRATYTYSAPYDTNIVYENWAGGNWDYSGTSYHTYNLLASPLEIDEYVYQGYSTIENYFYDSNNNLVHSEHEDWYYLHPGNWYVCDYRYINTDSLRAQVFANDTICPSDSAYIFVSITGGVPPYTITWGDTTLNTQTRLVHPDSLFTYHFTVTDSAGQTYSDSVTIFRHHPSGPIVILGPSTICPLDSITLSFSYSGIFGMNTWVQNSAFGNAPQFTVHDSGLVYLNIFYSVAGCVGVNIATTSTYIDLLQPHPSLGADTLICQNQSLILDPGPYVNYLWHDGSTSSTFNVPATSIGTYTYYVTVTDSNNCMPGADTIIVTIDPCSYIDPIENIISIVPNPASDYISIQSLFDLNGNSCSIYDLQAHKIYEEIIRENKIDINKFVAGIYLLKFDNKHIKPYIFIKE